MPSETIRRITGHRTTEIVLKHYYQLNREDFRNALKSKMPEIAKDYSMFLGRRFRQKSSKNDKIAVNFSVAGRLVFAQSLSDKA